MVEIEDSRQSGNLAGREDGFDIWRLLPLGSSLRPEDVVLSNERMNEEIGNRFVRRWSTSVSNVRRPKSKKKKAHLLRIHGTAILP